MKDRHQRRQGSTIVDEMKKKEKFASNSQVRLFDRIVPWKRIVKYLEITIDKGMNFTANI